MLAVAVSCSPVAGALSTTRTRVVPSGGKIAGSSYAKWLQIFWQEVFKTPPPGPQVCQTGTGPAVLLATALSPGSYNFTCTLPAGKPIYIVGLSTECSTLENPPSYGQTPAELEACARNKFNGAVTSASVDGQPVRSYDKLITGTVAFTIHLPKHNVIGSSKSIGMSAAYGAGLLLTGFPAGTHVVHVSGQIRGSTKSATYKLHVRCPPYRIKSHRSASAGCR